MQKTNLKNYLQLHLIIFIWGFTAVLGALISLDAIPLVWFRMLFAVGFLFVYFLYKKKSLRIGPKTMLKFMVGGLIISTHWVAFFMAIKVANVSIALVAMSTGALFTSLIEPLFFKRRVIFSEFLMGLIVVGGLYIIFRGEGGEYLLGIIYALIASFLSALFSVINGLYVRKYEGSVISFYQLFFGVVCITLYLLFTGGFSYEFFVLSTSDIMYLLILSSICTAYAFVVSVNVMKYLSPYTVMLSINLEPVYGIILALFIFGEKEKMTPEFYIGAVVIICTVVVNGIIKSKKSS
ncbi:MAG: EamA family transporter [Flavobacteriaceae bacterium]|nr:EamA family transporter [Flavobacteriaceae bacterium]